MLDGQTQGDNRGAGFNQSRPPLPTTSGVPSTAAGRDSPGREQPQSPLPTIALPRGEGAIRGIGEKFAANPVTGTGSMTVPIATSPGRAGFGPQLALSYDSSAGNGPFGFGWNLSLPAITRKTYKGLPQYRDTEESDVFILSGAEDLVPVLVEVGGRWQRETLPARTVDGVEYTNSRLSGIVSSIQRRALATTSKPSPCRRTVSRSSSRAEISRSIR